MRESSPDTLTVAVFAPVGRDGALTCSLLDREGMVCRQIASLEALCAEGLEVFGAVLLTEEALDLPDIEKLTAAIAVQPGWSDIAVLLFAGGELARSSGSRDGGVEGLTNVTVVERPVRTAAFVSLVRAALRARTRQYEMRDILVSLHAAREQAERASRLKDEFLATLSHELRTPLNAILGWTAMLRQNSIEPERVPRILEIVERNALAQAQLVSDVLDVSRMVAGKIRLDLRPMSLAACIKDAIDTVRPAADARGVTIELQASEGPLDINGDPERMQQVIWNLLSNAVKFTPQGGRVSLAAERRGRFAEITVTDTGVGLTPEFLPYVFDRFRQADQSFTRAHGGLGLGLSIVKQVVEMHGGQIAAASEGAGRGSVFTVRLPASAIETPLPNDAAVEDGQRAAAPVTVDLTGRNVLVVDDDSATRELLMTMLTKAGAIVTTAASANEAVIALDAHVPDFLVADIGMPLEDGLSLCRRLRARAAQQGGDVPAVALSAYTRAEDRSAALEAGFDAFVAKPTTSTDLLAAIRGVLERSVNRTEESSTAQDRVAPR